MESAFTIHINHCCDADTHYGECPYFNPNGDNPEHEICDFDGRLISCDEVSTCQIPSNCPLKTHWTGLHKLAGHKNGW